MTEMKDVDHTHPDRDGSFGEAFRRGPDVAADGGERSSGPRTERDAEAETNRTAMDVETDDEAPTMDEVDHTPTEGVSRSFERGTEGRSDAV